MSNKTNSTVAVALSVFVPSGTKVVWGPEQAPTYSPLVGVHLLHERTRQLMEEYDIELAEDVFSPNPYKAETALSVLGTRLREREKWPAMASRTT